MIIIIKIIIVSIHIVPFPKKCSSKVLYKQKHEIGHNETMYEQMKGYDGQITSRNKRGTGDNNT